MTYPRTAKIGSDILFSIINFHDVMTNIWLCPSTPIPFDKRRSADKASTSSLIDGDLFSRGIGQGEKNELNALSLL